MQALLVDGDPVLRQAIQWMLRDAGFTRVIEAADGEAALLSLRTGRPDLVVMSHKMSPMDGPTLAKALRVRGVSAPIVMMSADGAAGVLPTCVSARVAKPLNAAELTAAIRQCLATPALAG